MQVCEASFKEAGFDYIVTEKMVCAGGEKGEELILILSLICLKNKLAKLVDAISYLQIWIYQSLADWPTEPLTKNSTINTQTQTHCIVTEKMVCAGGVKIKIDKYNRNTIHCRKANGLYRPRVENFCHVNVTKLSKSSDENIFKLSPRTWNVVTWWKE